MGEAGPVTVLTMPQTRMKTLMRDIPSHLAMIRPHRDYSCEFETLKRAIRESSLASARIRLRGAAKR